MYALERNHGKQGPAANDGNDRIELMNLPIASEDLPLRISLSTATASFGGGCARELF